MLSVVTPVFVLHHILSAIQYSDLHICTILGDFGIINFDSMTNFCNMPGLLYLMK